MPNIKTPADRKRLAGVYNEPRMASGPGAYDCPPGLRPGRASSQGQRAQGPPGQIMKETIAAGNGLYITF